MISSQAGITSSVKEGICVTFFEYWQRYTTFIAVNYVVISIIVVLAIRGSWRFSGFALLILAVADLFVGRILRSKKNQISGQTYSTRKGGGFFRFYGYALVVGGLIRLAVSIKEGITWVDSGAFVILILLAIAMFSIGKRMNAPTGHDRPQERD